MEEKGFPWDGADRSFTAGDLAAVWKEQYSDGVADVDNDFLITVPNATQEVVQIGAGTAWIGGRRLELTSPVTISVPGEAGLYTEGYFNGGIFLKVDETNREFSFYTRYAKTGALSPAAPGEILIAKFYYWRPMRAMSTNIVVRSVSQSALKYPVQLGTDTNVAFPGLLKSADGLLQAAIPGVDYLAGTMYNAQPVSLRFTGGVTASGAAGLSFKNGGLAVVLVSFTIASVPSTAVPLVLRGLPHAKATGASAEAVSFCTVAGQGAVSGTVWGRVEKESGETVIKFKNGQGGTDLMTSQTPAGTSFYGVLAVYPTA